MARGLHRLTALQVERARGPKVLNDGGGLHLNVTATHTKSWFFRYHVERKERRKGLGALATTSMPTARQKAAACRQQLAAGIDPLEADDAEAEQAAKAVTFAAAAEAYIAAHKSGWRSPKHAAQWESTLTSYAGPFIGHLDVNAVHRPHLLQILEPIWSTRPETARRVRNRVELVLDYAHVKGWRVSEVNPARWRGGLRFALPAARPKVRHFAAMPYDRVPSFTAELRRQDSSVAAAAVELLVLCAVRLGDVVGQGKRRADVRPMMWTDVDLAAKLWVIPQTKSGTTFRVPLSDAALAVLQRMRPLRDSTDAVFPGLRRGQPLGASTLHRLLKRMEAEASLHGFRSAFRDWAAEHANFPNHVVEMALAHAIPNKVEAAYRRGDLLAQRRALMNEWATFLATGAERKVLALSPIR